MHINNRKIFDQFQLPIIRERLEQMEESKAKMIMHIEFKKPITMLIISIFLGELGIDRFMLGQTGLGVLKLLTLGGFGIWWLIDCFTVMSRTRKYNFEKIVLMLN